eukprot:SAG31_NODE_25406_length_462_cov_0.694215_2_plen_55_part_01
MAINGIGVPSTHVLHLKIYAGHTIALPKILNRTHSISLLWLEAATLLFIMLWMLG